MKRIQGFAIVVAGLMMGCAHGKVSNVQQPLEVGTLDKSTVIYVMPVLSDDTTFTGDKAGDGKTVTAARAKIHEEFNQRIAAALMKRGYTAKAVTSPMSHGVILQGHTSKVENGSAAARYFVGMGAGSANMITTFAMDDKTKGKSLARFEVVATSGAESGLGSYMENHLNDGASKTAEFIDTSLNPKKK